MFDIHDTTDRPVNFLDMLVLILLISVLLYSSIRAPISCLAASPSLYPFCHFSL